MEDFTYKEDIRATRLNALGSSDGKLIRQIAEMGSVPKSAYKRLAICKGLIELEEIPRTDAIRAGDELENIIYANYKATHPNAESNPLVVSKKYSTKNCRLLSHPDIRDIDEKNKAVIYIECKASKYTTPQVRDEYKEQLYIHSLLAKEEAAERGKEWKAKVFLAHYSTDGLDLSQEIVFDPERLTVREVHLGDYAFDVKKGMGITNDFLETFDFYSEGDEVDYEYLPSNVKEKFLTITNVLKEIKKKEKLVEDFKVMLFDFMLQKDIKGIKSDFFTISRVDPSVSVSFDAKKYLADLRKLHPRKVKKIEQEYRKETKRKGYATIKIKETEDNNNQK